MLTTEQSKKGGERIKNRVQENFVPLVVLVCNDGSNTHCCHTVSCDPLIVRLRAAMGATRTAATQCRASCPRTSPLSSSPLPTQPTCLRRSSRASQSRGVPCTSTSPLPCRYLWSPLQSRHVDERVQVTSTWRAHKPKKSACDHVDIGRNQLARSARAQGTSAHPRATKSP